MGRERVRWAVRAARMREIFGIFVVNNFGKFGAKRSSAVMFLIFCGEAQLNRRLPKMVDETVLGVLDQ